jgi:hypothetical protein
MKINYVIASWNGIRVKPDNAAYYLNVLKNHLNHLNKIKNSIDQITIMKPHNNNVNTYYNIELNDKVKIIDCENKYQSYGQWLKAVELTYGNFDYYIFIEDDYIPNIDDFDLKLIELYEEGSYLCSKGGSHAVISNGLISYNTIKDLIKNVKYNNWFDNYAKKHPDLVHNNRNFQIAFSFYFIENNIKITDYSQEYSVDYYAQNEFKDYSSHNVKRKEKIFTPIQRIY